MKAETNKTVEDVSSEEAERLLTISARVVVKMGDQGRETMRLPLHRAIPLAERFNRRMKRAGLSWRSRVIVQP